MIVLAGQNLQQVQLCHQGQGFQGCQSHPVETRHRLIFTEGIPLCIKLNTSSLVLHQHRNIAPKDAAHPPWIQGHQGRQEHQTHQWLPELPLRLGHHAHRGHPVKQEKKSQEKPPQVAKVFFWNECPVIRLSREVKQNGPNGFTQLGRFSPDLVADLLSDSPCHQQLHQHQGNHEHQGHPNGETDPPTVSVTDGDAPPAGVNPPGNLSYF